MAHTSDHCVLPLNFAMDRAPRPPREYGTKLAVGDQGNRRPASNRCSAWRSQCRFWSCGICEYGERCHYRQDYQPGMVHRELYVGRQRAKNGADWQEDFSRIAGDSSRSRRERSCHNDNKKRERTLPKEKPHSAAGDVDMFSRQPRSRRSRSASGKRSPFPQRKPPIVEQKTSPSQNSYSETPSNHSPREDSESNKKINTIGVKPCQSQSQDRPASARSTGRQRQHRKKTSKAKRRREMDKRKKFVNNLTELQLAAASSLGKTKKRQATSKITSGSSGAAPSVGPLAGHTDGAACSFGNSSYSSCSSD